MISLTRLALVILRPDSKGQLNIMKPASTSATAKLMLAFALAITIPTIPQAQGQAFNVVYNFTGESDGGESLAGLTVDTAGNLYGTTSSGGLSNVGVVFKVTPSGAETVL